MEEAQAHINILELRAAFLALKTYASLIEQPAHLALDRQSHCDSLPESQRWYSIEVTIKPALEIWEWCLQRNLTIHEEHIPREVKQLSRFRISLDFTFQRLEIGCECVQCSHAEDGPLLCRSIRSETMHN